VLGDWEKSIHSAADSLLEGLGALVVFGVEALPLLQGGDSWLERFSQLLVPPPLLEAKGNLEAWPALLKRHYLKPSSDNQQANQQGALVLLEQDRERLLEERLQQAIGQLNSRQQQVVILRHGLVSGEEMSLKNIGTVIGTSRSTVRNVLLTAMRALRKQFAGELVASYLA
jgi:RNA polymerase sigma factor (sigma-70 family)